MKSTLLSNINIKRPIPSGKVPKNMIVWSWRWGKLQEIDYISFVYLWEVIKYRNRGQNWYRKNKDQINGH